MHGLSVKANEKVGEARKLLVSGLRISQWNQGFITSLPSPSPHTRSYFPALVILHSSVPLCVGIRYFAIKYSLISVL